MHHGGGGHMAGGFPPHLPPTHIVAPGVEYNRGHIAPGLLVAEHYEGPAFRIGVGAKLPIGFHMGIGIGFNPYPGFELHANRPFRRCVFGPNYGLIRHCPLTLGIGRRVVLPLNFGMPLTDIMIIYDARLGSYRCADDLDIAPCAFNQHVILQLPEYTEFTFQDPVTLQTRVYFADSYCSICGQHFFIDGAA